MTSLVERITGPALRLTYGSDYAYLVGSQHQRHHHLAQVLVENGWTVAIIPPEDQGFFTSHGRYVGRELARHIAFASGQVTATTHQRELFTEDLW